MSKYRGFTVSFNAIGAGKSTRKYLVLANSEMLMPLLNSANRNMIEAKCSCQMVVNTRSLYRRGACDTWLKYQLVMIVAPTRSKHAQAKRLLEGILPGSVNLEEYRDTAMARVQYHEFVPDNKPLVYGFQRCGIMHHRFGEVYDLLSPAAPPKDRETRRQILSPWHVTKRERAGIFLTTKNFPLERQLNMLNLLDMLLLGANQDSEQNNASNYRSRARKGGMSDATGQPRNALTTGDVPRRRRSSSALGDATPRMPSVSFGLQ